jgi:hypothetical protein
LVMTVCSAFVPLFFTVTVAWGTAAPLASITVPPMAPSVVDCAKAPQANNTMTIRARQYRTMEASIPLVLIKISPFLLLATLQALAHGPEPLRGGV